MELLASITSRLLDLHGSAALALVFAIPALEASAFVGFVFPGEIAVLLGGVLAFQGRISLLSAIAAAVLGAVLGDTAGYVIGRTWGEAMIHGTLGRIPIVRRHLARSLDTAKAYVNRRGGRAVFFGRFTTALRVLVPGLAGMARLPYGRFFVWNAIGGAVWGAGFVLLGFVAGAAWHQVAGVASIVGLVLLALVVVLLVAVRVARRWEDRDYRVRLWIERTADVPPFGWIRRRFPRQLVWLRARLNPTSPRGFPLAFAAALTVFCAWAIGSLTQDVVANEEAVRLDPRVERFFVGHRVGWITAFMKVVTWLGSVSVVVPVAVAVMVILFVRRRDLRLSLVALVVLMGAIASVNVMQEAVARRRPPASVRLVSVGGWSFPSGHTTQALAGWGMMALVGSAGRRLRAGSALWAAAALIALMVGVSRIYLGAHWFTDVLGAYALAGVWLAAGGAVLLATARRDEPLDEESVPS